MQMSLGEKANLTITPDFGYGNEGAGGVIPGGATLLFEVELLAIGKSTRSTPIRNTCRGAGGEGKVYNGGHIRNTCSCLYL